MIYWLHHKLNITIIYFIGNFLSSFKVSDSTFVQGTRKFTLCGIFIAVESSSFMSSGLPKSTQPLYHFNNLQSNLSCGYFSLLIGYIPVALKPDLMLLDERQLCQISLNISTKTDSEIVSLGQNKFIFSFSLFSHSYLRGPKQQTSNSCNLSVT